jgi:hypothetical protein
MGVCQHSLHGDCVGKARRTRIQNSTFKLIYHLIHTPSFNTINGSVKLHNQRGKLGSVFCTRHNTQQCSVTKALGNDPTFRRHLPADGRWHCTWSRLWAIYYGPRQIYVRHVEHKRDWTHILPSWFVPSAILRVHREGAVSSLPTTRLQFHHQQLQLPRSPELPFRHRVVAAKLVLARKRQPRGAFPAIPQMRVRV